MLGTRYPSWILLSIKKPLSVSKLAFWILKYNLSVSKLSFRHCCLINTYPRCTYGIPFLSTVYTLLRPAVYTKCSSSSAVPVCSPRQHSERTLTATFPDSAGAVLLPHQNHTRTVQLSAHTHLQFDPFAAAVGVCLHLHQSQCLICEAGPFG